MKKIIFILIAAAGLWIGCAQQRQAQGRTDSDGLTLQISVPSREVKPNGTVSAFLVLSNGGSQSIRFSLLADPIRSEEPGGRFDVAWVPGFYKSDGPSPAEFVQSVQTLQPGKRVEWPFEMIVGTNKILHVTAHYSSSNVFYQEADLWRGNVDAQPLTIRFDR